MKFSVKDFFSKNDQICRKLGIWSHLLKKSFMESLIFCAVITCVLGNITYLCFLVYNTKIVYQHSAPTKVLLRYTGLYNHGNDQTIFLFMEKRLGDSKYIY